MAYHISFGILLQRRMMSVSRLWKQLWAIAAPIALQNLILSSINLVDVFMISRLGDIFIAGAGIANQIYFLFILTLFGINSGGPSLSPSSGDAVMNRTSTALSAWPFS